jgi:hypothetical protein
VLQVNPSALLAFQRALQRGEEGYEALTFFFFFFASAGYDVVGGCACYYGSCWAGAGAAGRRVYCFVFEQYGRWYGDTGESAAVREMFWRAFCSQAGRSCTLYLTCCVWYAEYWVDLRRFPNFPNFFEAKLIKYIALNVYLQCLHRPARRRRYS